ncbi:MAG: AI-2E family transporter, partial [Chloroflexi bacterium]|nr:AI-2E family transporter [Chloroflexota bacterium]
GYSLDLTQLVEQFDIDILGLSNQLLLVLQPILGQTANLLGVVATSTALLIGWGAFVLIVSYFLLADSGPVSKSAQNFEFPGIMADFSRMGRELGRIWNAFLRGQLFLFATAVVGSFIIMVIAGVENALGLAFLVGLGKFVPYIGPFVANIAVALVAFFQPGNYLNLEPIVLVLIVVGILFVMDQVFDNIIVPRLYGNVLGIHPAALLVTAIILATLIGLTGIILAAPVLASLQMFAKYAIRKMLDQNPWPEPEQHKVDFDFPLEEPIRRIIDKVKNIITRKRKKRNE